MVVEEVVVIVMEKMVMVVVVVVVVVFSKQIYCASERISLYLNDTRYVVGWAIMCGPRPQGKS